MKVTGSGSAAGAMLLFVGMSILILPNTAIAADPSWRPYYDVALRWINFIILVAVIVKYAREPIKDFFKHRKADVASQIDQLDHEKERILEQIKAAEKRGIENQARLTELKKRLVAQGETRKQQLIQQAKQQSTIMIEETRRKMENRIVQAKASLKMELLDLAIDQAIAKLPGEITEGDNQRLLDDYMHRLHS